MPSDYYYLKTGNPYLDRILAMDVKDQEEADKARHGIRCEHGEDSGGVPIVLILGGAGTGKTTLALQFATEVATKKRNSPNECGVFFYSLEQSTVSLRWAHTSFGFAADASFRDFADPVTGGLQPGHIHLCHFAPLPISATEAAHAFEDRFSQLCHMIGKVKSHKPPVTPVFFIDSLNAIATSNLPRNAIYRLFTLFRSQGIPAIITAEQTARVRGDEASISEDARFLADVVIELTSEESAGHYLTYLQICKSRIRRQALGRHLYKIRVAPEPDPGATTPRSRFVEGQPKGGFLVYPSLPSIVSMTREPHPRKTELEYHLSRKGDADASIKNLMQGDTVRPGACFSLVGPAGTHKLALGLNLATGYLAPRGGDAKDGTRNLLIISFGSYTAVDLAGVAWFTQRKNWSRCRPPKDDPQPKWQTVEFEFFEQDGQTPPPKATQLMFRMGHLTPEECFYRIRYEIEKDKGTYSSVLVWDTAQIRTGFPLLRSESLFLPTLVDFFHEKGLVSLFIGVQENDGTDREMDSALESAADYRVSLSHYPNPYDLAKIVFQPQPDERQTTLATPKLYEQLVSVVVDNVTGKHYGRHPRWLMVEQPSKNEKEKRLKCLETPECAVELRKRDVERSADMVTALREAARLYAQDDRPAIQALARKLETEAGQLAAAAGLAT